MRKSERKKETLTKRDRAQEQLGDQSAQKKGARKSQRVSAGRETCICVLCVCVCVCVCVVCVVSRLAGACCSLSPHSSRARDSRNPLVPHTWRHSWSVVTHTGRHR